ncbi:TetR/AcrR family transcriptional regulator [Levilactobacillus brevis]|nr:TetR family transcriptional regulator [Levilactobacillus brevis]KIO98474.1 Transcriptional regulator, TetR family [Levilactobacillus brevis]SQG75049.1 TetR family transcriptional regulator [Levilactobacillus brevis]
MAASETKERIAEALASLLNHNTFDKITVREIADEAEVHRKTFYYYFADKYELLAFVYEHFIVESPRHEQPVALTLENWRPAVIQLLERIADNSKIFLNAYPLMMGFGGNQRMNLWQHDYPFCFTQCQSIVI